MDRTKKIVKVSLIGIIGNIILVGFKAFIGFLAGSVSIILDAVNNLTDALSSVVTIIGTKLASKKPDKKHPYGYGRIEYLTSLIIGVIIIAAGISAITSSVDKIIHPTAPDYSIFTLVIIAAAILVKIALGIYFQRQGKKLNSDSLVASGKDAMFDSIVSTSTLIAVIIGLIWKGVNIEGYIGILISVFILKAGVEVLLETLSGLIGKRVDDDLANALKEKIDAFPEVLGTYDLTLHNYGPEKLIGSVHIEVNDDMSAHDIHILTRKITQMIYQDFGIIITVGIYANNTMDEETKEIKDYLVSLIEEKKEILSYHGFYVDKDLMIITIDVIFDLATKNIQEIKKEIVDKMKEKYSNYYFDIVLDTDFAN